MGRRSKLPPTIPPDFTLHDGQGEPELSEKTTHLEIFTAMGSKQNTTPEALRRYAESPWTWRFDKPRGAEIIAYREWFQPPRIEEGRAG